MTTDGLRYNCRIHAASLNGVVVLLMLICVFDSYTQSRPGPVHITPQYGHNGAIWAVAYSPDGTTFASGGTDKTIKLWSVQDDRLIATLEGHTCDIWSLAYSPDGTIIASGSCDNTINIWIHNKLYTTLRGHTGIVTSLAFSPDGKYLASASSDCTIRLWSMETYAQVKISNRHIRFISSIAYAPDGKKIVSGSYDNSVRIWSPWESDYAPIIYSHEDSVFSVAFSPDGREVASGGFDGTIKLWNIQDNKLDNVLFTSNRAVSCCIAFSPDGTLLAAGDYNGHMNVWDFTGLIGYHSPDTGHASYISSIAFSPDGKTIISGSKDSTIKFWRVPQPPIIGSIIEYPDSIKSISYAPHLDPPLLASADGSNFISVWSMENGAIIRTIPTDEPCNAVSFSGCGDTLAAACGKQVRLFSAMTGKSLITMPRHHANMIHSLAFSGDNRMIASECGDKTILVHSRTGAPLARLKKWFSDERYIAVAFAPKHNDRVITLSNKGKVKVWSVSKKKVVKQLGDSHLVGNVTSIAVSLDGLRYAMATDSNVVEIRSFPDDTLVCQYSEQYGGISSICFSPDGARCATGNVDGTISVRTTSNGKAVKALRGNDGLAILSLLFAGDKPATLISGGYKRSIRLWHTEDTTWLLTSYMLVDSEYVTFNRDGYFVCSDLVRTKPEKYLQCSIDEKSNLSSTKFWKAYNKSDIISDLLAWFTRGQKKPLIAVTHPDTLDSDVNLADDDTSKKARPVILGRTGKNYAIVIGIADYRDLPPPETPGNNLTDLKYSDRDAAAFRKFLEDTARSLGNWDITYLVNANATKVNVDNALTPVLANAKKDDNICIFFSGHGRCHRDKPNDIYLLTYDFQPSDFRDGFAYDDLLELIEDCKAKHVFAFIDACKSGTIGSKGYNASFDQSILEKKISKFPSNRIIFTSAKGAQVSWEDDEFQMGTFSYFLIQGLNGCAYEYGESSFISLNELEDYVVDNVKKRTRNKTLQTPGIYDIIGTINYELPIANRLTREAPCQLQETVPLNVLR